MRLEFLEYIKDGLPKGFVPYTIYSIIVHDTEVGRLILREGNDEECYYDGHLGYTIYEEYRGHHYGYKACVQLQRMINKDHVIITCDPSNIPSQKIVKKLNCQYLGRKMIPQHLKKFYTKDEIEKDIYIWKIK